MQPTKQKSQNKKNPTNKKQQQNKTKIEEPKQPCLEANMEAVFPRSSTPSEGYVPTQSKP